MLPIPDWLVGSGNAVYPGEQASPISSNNNVVIDYDPTNLANIAPNYVYGGLTQQGDSVNNAVVIVDVSMDGNVTGGFSANNGNAANNSVSVNGGTISSVHGGYSTGGNATGNRVIVSGGLLNTFAYGGYTASGDASDNAVVLSNGGIGRGVRGGQSVNGDAVNNFVTISGGTVSGDVRSGWSISGDASGNSISMDGGSVTNGMYGGYSSKGRALNNAVTINGGIISGDVRGGYSNSGNVTGNTVTVAGGLLNDVVYGGYTASGDASGNAVVLNGGGIARGIRGGNSSNGAAERNSVTINGGTVSGDIRGGFSSGGNAMNNTAAVTGGAVNGNIYGGWGSNSDAVGNNVIISDGSVSGAISGGYSGNSGNSIRNTVTITGGSISGNVRGGNIVTSGDAAYNTINISGGTIGGYVRGGNTASGDAMYNAVSISDGTVNSDIRGGSSDNGSAGYNSVTVSGGNIAGNIYGGYADGSAINNVVTLTGSPSLASSVIYGGFSLSGEDAITGNTLNVKSTGITVSGVSNFESLSFWLPDDAADGDTALSVTNAADLTGVTANVLLQGNGVLNEGYKIALLDNTAGGLTGTTDNGTSQAWLGTTVLYDFDVYADSDILWAELTSASAAPRARALTASRLAPLAFLAQGADLVSSLEYLEVSRDKESRYTAFVEVTGGSSAYEAGSNGEIDIDGFSLIAGIMWNAPLGRNSLQLRAFIEAGWGDYDTGGSLAGAGGDMDYYGGGLYMRYSWLDEDKPGGLYADASLRTGRIDTDFGSALMTNNAGVSASYDTDSAYYGAHIGLGRVWRIGNRTSLDLSGKLLWTRLEDSGFTMSAGDRVHLDSVNSNRFRAGFRVTRDSTERLSLFCGAYYEYEFDGDADGRLYGVYAIDRSSLSGGTGIGELGLILRPAGGDRLSAMLGVQGYAGAREGFSGKLAVQYAF